MNANCKLHGRRLMRKYLIVEKTKLLGSAFIDSQFNHVPLIWMFCQKTLYLKMVKVHHKTLSYSPVKHLESWFARMQC